jgi:hypothetical protein
MRNQVTALLIALLTSAGATAQTAEQCAAVLTLTGRNELLSLREGEKLAYFYKQACRGESTDLGLSFEKAKISLGLTYSSREQFCEQEKSRQDERDFNYLRTRRWSRRPSRPGWRAFVSRRRASSSRRGASRRASS